MTQTRQTRRATLKMKTKKRRISNEMRPKRRTRLLAQEEVVDLFVCTFFDISFFFLGEKTSPPLRSHLFRYRSLLRLCFLRYLPLLRSSYIPLYQFSNEVGIAVD